jgi:hypothetical protein
MSLRNRARRLQRRTGLTYQQALNWLRAHAGESEALTRRYGWPIHRADLHAYDPKLVEASAPIEVVDLRQVDPIEAICQELLDLTASRGVTLLDDKMQTLCHLPPGEATFAVRLFRGAMGGRTEDALSSASSSHWFVDGVSMAAEPVGKSGLLVVIFEQDETSLGLVRLRMKQAAKRLEPLLKGPRGVFMPPQSGGGGSAPPAEARLVVPKRRS